MRAKSLKIECQLPCKSQSKLTHASFTHNSCTQTADIEFQALLFLLSLTFVRFIHTTLPHLFYLKKTINTKWRIFTTIIVYIAYTSLLHTAVLRLYSSTLFISFPRLQTHYTLCVYIGSEGCSSKCVYSTSRRKKNSFRPRVGHTQWMCMCVFDA